MRAQLNRLMNDQSGATAIEYGLIVILLSTAAIAAYTLLGTNLGTSMNNVAGSL